MSSDFSNILDHLQNNLSTLQVGRASPGIVENVKVEAYGDMTELKNCASVSVLDNQTLSIQPWDASLAKAIDSALQKANLGLGVQNMTSSVLVKFPPMTEERRKSLVKLAEKQGEESKIALRTHRQDGMRAIKTLETSKQISEDVARKQETELQKQVDLTIQTIESLVEKKSLEIMKI